MNFEESNLGKIEVSDAVIKDIAIHSYIEFTKGSIKDQKAKKDVRNAIEIDVSQDETGKRVVTIEVNTKVKYGLSIPEFGRGLQEKMKNDVENFSGLTVSEISVNIEDVYEEAAIQPEWESAEPVEDSEEKSADA